MATRKLDLFHRRQRRVRYRLRSCNKGRLRLSVHRSNRNISAQLIDDSNGTTLVAASSREGKLQLPKGGNAEAAATIGEAIARRATGKGITQCYFDRGGYSYHGRVKALADAARAGGLEF
ncbi:MAG: 50S ribosomal protein L18 [Rhodobacteraceae bacterium]|nr:50S ribosomal protein L18 [Paracoccaceae bacterium]